MLKKLNAILVVAVVFAVLVLPLAKLPFSSVVKADNYVWKEIVSQSSYPIKNITFDGADSSIMFGTDSSGKLLLSKDYGKTWTTVENSLPPDMVVFAIVPIEKEILIAGNKGVFVSTSHGSSWVGIFPFYATAVDTDRSNSDIIIVGTNTGKVYKSVNGGNGWTEVATFGYRVNDISVSGANGKYVIVATEGGTYKTSNGGINWSKVYSKRTYKCEFDPTSSDIIVMTAIDVNGNPLKVLLSEDGGNSWIQPDKLKSFTVYDFSFASESEGIIYFATEKYGVVKAEDLGRNIDFFSNGMPYTWINAVSINPKFADMMYAVAVEFNPTANYHFYYLSCPVESAGNFIAYFDSDAVRFSWKYMNTENPERFDVYYKTQSTSSFKKLKTVDGKERFCSVDGKNFVPDIEYEFMIKACSGLNCSVSVTDTAMKLKKPKLLNVILYSNTEKDVTLRISWDRTSIDKNAEYINIFRNDPDCTGWFCLPVLIKSIKRDDPEFGKGFTSIAGLKPDRRYVLFISVNERRFGKGMDFSYSDSKEIFVPAIPQNFKAYSKGKYVYFEWEYDKSAQNRIDKFIIYAKNALLPKIEIPVYMRKAKSAPITKFGRYDFVISAVKGTVKTCSEADSAFVLKTPEEPVVSFADKGVKIEWQKEKIDLNANKVQIARKIGNSMYMVIATVDKNIEEYVDKMTQTGNTYRYAISAVRAKSGERSDTSELSSFSEIEFIPPSAPLSLTTKTISCRGVSLIWKDTSSNETSFVVERKEKGKNFEIIAEVKENETQFTDESVEEKKIYVYRVKAINGAGNSEYSNEITVSVPMCEDVPKAPSELTAFVTKNGVVLEWKDNSDNEEGFIIERRGEKTKFTSIGKTGKNKSVFEDNTIIRGKTYAYRVKAFNNKGESEYSNESEVTVSLSKIVIILQPDNEMMLVNGIKREIDPGRGTKPVIVKSWSRTVVPVRAIVEALGGTIEWNGNERKVTIKFNGNIIELWIDNPKAKVNGQTKWIDENNHNVKPIIINDRTMLPLRFVAENLGCKVEWDGNTRTITIIYPAT